MQTCSNLDVLRPNSESSRPTPRRCWRSLGPLSRALGARLTNNNNNNNSNNNNNNNNNDITKAEGHHFCQKHVWLVESKARGLTPLDCKDIY